MGHQVMCFENKLLGTWCWTWFAAKRYRAVVCGCVALCLTHIGVQGLFATFCAVPRGGGSCQVVIVPSTPPPPFRGARQGAVTERWGGWGGCGHRGGPSRHDIAQAPTVALLLNVLLGC